MVSQCKLLQTLIVPKTSVSDVKPLKNSCPCLKFLDLDGSAVLDVSPLIHVPSIRELAVPNRGYSHEDLVISHEDEMALERSIETLKNASPHIRFVEPRSSLTSPLQVSRTIRIHRSRFRV